MDYATPKFSQLRIAKHTKSSEKKDIKVLLHRALEYFLWAFVWMLSIWLVSPDGLSNGWNVPLVRGGMLLFLGICGQLMLRVVAPDAGTMRSYWPLLLAMLLFSLVEVRIENEIFNWVMLRTSYNADAMLIYPNAIVPVMVGMLYGGPVALVVGLGTSAALGIAGNFSLGVFLVALCSTCVAAALAPSASRSRDVTCIVWRIVLLQTLVGLVVLFREQPSLTNTVLQMTAYYVALTLSLTVFAVVLLPFAERMTKRISCVTLARYASLENPLLKQLLRDAAGTYHHSVMVGDLAQTAADVIGANGILARVGAYYHDIGKLGNPHLYMENQSGEENPHDKYPPNISRLLIVNHVKDGIVTARLNNLPVVIQRMIAVHHGTSVIRWFKIKEEKRIAASGTAGCHGGDIESFYRYDGPLPVSREETIISLADSIEAAARSLKDHSRAALENLVSEIIKDRWYDGQLSMSVLTNAELEQVRQSFIISLTHIYHGRSAYPSRTKGVK